VTQHIPNPSKHDPDDRRWTVEFRDVHTRTPEQEKAIRSLDPDVLARVLEIWLAVITPGASFERQDAMPRLISFSVRSHARRLLSCFGGRLLVTSRSQWPRWAVPGSVPKWTATKSGFACELRNRDLLSFERDLPDSWDEAIWHGADISVPICIQ
jgi:hypothetical protein